MICSSDSAIIFSWNPYLSWSIPEIHRKWILDYTLLECRSIGCFSYLCDRVNDFKFKLYLVSRVSNLFLDLSAFESIFDFQLPYSFIWTKTIEKVGQISSCKSGGIRVFNLTSCQLPRLRVCRISGFSQDKPGCDSPWGTVHGSGLERNLDRNAMPQSRASWSESFATAELDAEQWFYSLKWDSSGFFIY